MEILDCLCIGDLVELKKDKKGYKGEAEIMFIGEVLGKEGIFYGVSLDKPWKGKHNGTFKNIKYFETMQHKGLLISKDRIVKVLKKAKHHNKAENKRITINSCVSISKLNCNGTVKFIGILGNKPGTFYGLELETAKGKNNGTANGRHYFKCGNNYGIFLRIKDLEILDDNHGYYNAIPQPPQAQISIIQAQDNAIPPPPPPQNPVKEMEPGAQPGVEPGSMYETEGGYDDSKDSEARSRPQIQIQIQPAVPPQITQHNYPVMQHIMLNQFNVNTTNMMDANTVAMQQKLMKMQQDIIENPSNAGQKWGNKALNEEKDGMFGDEYCKIEGILRVIGCNDESCKFYLNRMCDYGIADDTLYSLDTVNDIKTFKQIFPDDVETLNRFRYWLRYDVQKCIPSFKKEKKKLKPKSQRTKSLFGKVKEKEEIVYLNIGGIEYTTLKSTLIDSGSGFFKKLLKKKRGKNNDLSFDGNGSYFVNERNGMLFEPILNYMQTAKLCINYNKFSLNEILREFKYYDISFPKENNKLPQSFRFEYIAGNYYYNLEQQKYDFMVRDFRILGSNKKAEQIITKNANIEWHQATDDIEQFLKNKNKFKSLNYKMIQFDTYRCDDKPNTDWTVVEYYQKYIWYKKV